jgi:streptogramin lyase
VYDSGSKTWTVHRLPGGEPHAYAVYVDDKDKVWVSDFGANAILNFDPTSERFETFPSDKPDAAVRQLNGRAGEVWGAESGADRLVVITSGSLGSGTLPPSNRPGAEEISLGNIDHGRRRTLVLVNDT